MMSDFSKSRPKHPVRSPLRFLNSYVPSLLSLISHHFQIWATHPAVPTLHSVAQESAISVPKIGIKRKMAQATIHCLPPFVHPREAFYLGYGQKPRLNQLEQIQEDKPCLWVQQIWQTSTTVCLFFLDSLNQPQQHSFAFSKQDHLPLSLCKPLASLCRNCQHMACLGVVQRLPSIPAANGENHGGLPRRRKETKNPTKSTPQRNTTNKKTHPKHKYTHTFKIGLWNAAW